MKKFIKSLLSEAGEWSFKRVIGVLGFLVLSYTLIVCVHSKSVKNPPDNLVSAIELIVIAAIFGTVGEKIRLNSILKSKTESKTPENEN